ncbi:MAG TPA: ribosomal L7Ae/L30e/S12e/Gadd45 family protein [Longimicrobiales bacterium]|nr:ribosomal L7Ae/L30e/S12e/Gadd45 family protein [Longimicrobiales bacterium]
MSRASSVYGLLGLARRAGAIVPGTAAVRDSVRSGEAKLVLLAGDASVAQLDKVRRILEKRSVPQVSLGDRAALGAAVGTGPISAVAVTSTPLAGRMLTELGDAAPAYGTIAAVVEAAQE